MPKKTHQYSRAVGLEYRAGADRAPVVCLKGDAVTSDEIVRIAHRFGVPVVTDGAVARALSTLKAEEEIPEELYEAVATIIARLQQEPEKSRS